MKPTLCLAVVTLAALELLLPGREAAAGANETPGISHLPHAFSSYTPVTAEMGGAGLAAFQQIVVTSQHYAQGAAYADAGNGEVIGSTGIENFVHFCSDQKADVMYMNSHGYPDHSTLIQSFAPTARGKALRDSVLASYVGQFVDSSFVACDTPKRYGIKATPTFYANYFKTPQAFCWWAVCYSSALKLTGPGQARCFVSYDLFVNILKAHCAEDLVLSRMDGQETQAKRSLLGASFDVNFACRDDNAKLIVAGKLNTVLSPTVIEYAPTGTVCVPTPGHVKFDCTLDTAVPPDSVVRADGMGHLTGRVWNGDDRVDFTVVPDNACNGVIVYTAREQMCLSLADHARLDGNTKPAVNARGPNQDDFTWFSTCTSCPVSTWQSMIASNINPTTDLVAGNNFTVYTPVVNASASPTTGTVSLHVDGLTLPVESVPLALAGQASTNLAWTVPIPPSAPPGAWWAVHLVAAPDGQPSSAADGTLALSEPLSARFVGRPEVFPGDNSLALVIDNNSPTFTADLTGLTFGNDLGWVGSVSPTTLSIPPRGSAPFQLTLTVPPGTASGTTNPCVLQGLDAYGPRRVGVSRLTVLLKLHMQEILDADWAVGSSHAQCQFLLENLGDQPISPTYAITSSHAFPAVLAMPAFLQPHQPAIGTATFTIPPIASLAGQSDGLHLVVTADGYSAPLDLDLVIAPPIEIDLSGLGSTPLFTGWAVTHPFSSTITLRNHSDLPLSGSFRIPAGTPTITPATAPFTLAARGSQGIPVQVQIPADFLPGSYSATAQTLSTAFPPNPLATATASTDLKVTTPVVVRFDEMALAGTAGQPFPLSATLVSYRTDRAFTGTYHWGDANGWIAGDLNGGYSALAPVPIALTLQLPPGSPGPSNRAWHPASALATATSDSVALDITVVYDTGTIGTAHGDIVVNVLPGNPGSAGVPPTNLPTALDAVRPNPFGTSAEVRFRLATPGRASLSVHDVTGRRIATLVDGYLEAGDHFASWDGRDDAGRRAAVGVYFIRFESAALVRTRKAVLMR